ncbi:MAG: amidohydrolase [Dermatophilus congolensis]|nr:amidohydrolase [Dermatophilus congolensis]
MTTAPSDPSVIDGGLTCYVDELVAWRRHLHQYPELSFAEHETVAYIEAQLRRRLAHATFRNLTPTSLVVTLDTGRPGPKLGLRADIDALPVQEDQPNLDFASTVPGRMHACGHDAHTATVMAAIAWADDHLDSLTGEIHAIFQHAEELPPGGAKEMVETGYFTGFDFIYGFHYFSTLPTGTVDIKDGPASSNSDLFTITLTGLGGHASMPAATIDPVVAAAALVTQLQTIVSRRVDAGVPVVVSTTYLAAGTDEALNVIPGVAKVGGSVRTQSEESRELVQRSMREFLAGLEASNPGMKAELDYLVGYDGVWNDPVRTQRVRELAQARWGERVVAEPAMLGGEDFSAFSRVAPATYVFVGSGSEGKPYTTASHHSSGFGLDEDSFPIGLALAVDVIINGPAITRP